MVDISVYISQIQLASRGEEVRDAICRALDGVNRGTEYAADSEISIDSLRTVQNRAVAEALEAAKPTVSGTTLIL